MKKYEVIVNGRTVVYEGSKEKAIKVMKRWKVGGYNAKIGIAMKNKNPSEILKSGEWTPAHAIRIKGGKLEILR